MNTIMDIISSQSFQKQTNSEEEYHERGLQTTRNEWPSSPNLIFQNFSWKCLKNCCKHKFLQSNTLKMYFKSTILTIVHRNTTLLLPHDWVHWNIPSLGSWFKAWHLRQTVQPPPLFPDEIHGNLAVPSPHWMHKTMANCPKTTTIYSAQEQNHKLQRKARILQTGPEIDPQYVSENHNLFCGNHFLDAKPQIIEAEPQFVESKP